MSPSFGATFLQFAAPLACQALWVAPLPTVRKMKTKRSTEGLPPTGFFAMAANGYLWSMYGASAGKDADAGVSFLLTSLSVLGRF